MPNGANTYTTYLRTELDPAARQSYSQLRTIAEATYRDIGRFAQDASGVTAAALGDRRTVTALRGIETASNSTFASIRREATTTSAAVSSLQARLAGIRSASIGSAVGGVSPSQSATSRVAATANDNLAASTRRVGAAAEGAAVLQRRQQLVTAAAAAETGKLSRGLTVLGTTLSVVQGPLGPVAGRINAITAAVTTLGTGTLVLAGAATALFAFAGVANVYAEVESRLRPLYSSQEQVNSALRETGRIALATRSALAPTADLYAKLTSAGRDYGLTSRQVSRVTETASKAATLSGGNAASREAGLYQFSQGLASGKLGGDELRSILENIPELARAIAAGFKNVDGSIGTTIGNLRKMGAEGQLSTLAVVDALSRSGGRIDAAFAKLPKTISSARTEFVTSFTLMTGRVDQTIGVTHTLAEAISVAANNLQLLLALGGAMAARFILPKLGGFLADLRTGIALQSQLSGGAVRAAAQGTATLLTPTGIERAKATTGFNDAAAATSAARARVAAEQQVVAAIEQEIAATRAAAEADREKTRSVIANSRFQTAAAEQRLIALRAELEQTVQARTAAATSVGSFDRVAPAVNRPLEAGEAEATRSARIVAFTKQQSAAKLELAQADLRVGAAARALAAAEAELTVAMEAEAAATTTSANAANNSARRGFALLGLAQQRAAATAAVAAAEIEEAAASTALGAAQGRLTAAQVAYNSVVSVTTRALGGLRTGAAAVVQAFGGPMTLALTAITGLMIYLAGQTNAALDALHNFAGGQEELYRRLGITTDKLREQSAAARDLALALAQAGVVKARNARADANEDLAKSLTAAGQQLAPGGSLGAGRVFEGQQQGRDTDLLLSIADKLRAGLAISPAGIRAIADIQARNPDAFRTSGVNGALLRFQGARPDDTSDKILGAEASRLSLKDATTTLNEVKAELAKPRMPPKEAPKPLTPAQIIAQGTAAAGKLEDPKTKALDTLEDAKKRILAKKDSTDQEKVDEIAEATAAYRTQIAAIDKRNERAGRADARRAASALAKEEREAAKATRETAAATERLADLRSRYDDQPKLVDQVRNDQRAFQALIGQNVNVTGADGRTTRREYTAADAAADQGRAQTALNKPFTDMTREMERQLQIQSLTLQGREAEAAALGQAFQLIDRTGSIEAGQYDTLVSLADQQRTINAALEERGRIVSALTGTVDSLRQSVTSFLDDLPNRASQIGKTVRNSAGDERKYNGLDFVRESLGGLGGQVLGQYRSASNQLGVGGLFAGVQKKIDDFVSGRTGLKSATDFAAEQTRKSGTAVQRFGAVVDRVSDSVEAVIDEMRAGVGGDSTGIPNPFQDALPAVFEGIGDLGKSITDLGKGFEGATFKAPEITIDDNTSVVMGRRLPKEDKKPLSLREVYNETGRSIGEKIDVALGTKFAAKVGGQLGNALSGANKGTQAAALARAAGIGNSQTGAALGGALGGVLSGITSISSALGPFGAALAPVLGIAGSVIGGLLKKSSTGSASITSVDGAATVSGNSASKKATATGLAGSVQSSLSDIAQQLFADTGQFAVSIGMRDKKYVVDTSGRGSTKYGKANDGITAYDTEAEAVEAALRDAISDGAIKGISAASQRILQSGQDLQKALNKALLIESIPRRLLAIQNPVRAAVEDLNREFQTIIAALNEGGASAQQYADAQKLYDLERVKAIEEAQKSATSAIDAYLKNMAGGTDSPYNKRTVYENAQGELEKLAVQIRAGKAVDDNDLLAAAKNVEDASRALNGSSQAFFSDFEALRTLLGQARDLTAAPVNGDTTLPASPFETNTDAIRALAQGQSSQTAALSTKLDEVISAIQNSAVDWSTLAGLPSGETRSAIGLLPGFSYNLA